MVGSVGVVEMQRMRAEVRGRELLEVIGVVSHVALTRVMPSNLDDEWTSLDHFPHNTQI